MTATRISQRLARQWRGGVGLSTIELALLGAVLLWAFNFTVVKHALSHGFSPLAYAGPRYFIAGALFAAFAARREGSLRIVGRADTKLIVIAALAGICLNQIVFVYAISHATASTVALLFGTAPVFVALFLYLFRKENIGGGHWISTIASVLGVALVVAGSAGHLGGNWLGLLLGIATAITWAIYSVSAAPLMLRYSSLRLNAVITLAGSLPLLAIAAIPLLHQDWSHIPASSWLAFLYSTIVAGVITNAIWFIALNKIGAVRASLYGNLEPFFAALLAVLVLAETIAPLQIIGGAVLLASVLIARRRDTIPLAE
jgi:drug/metabolite transporter (DMT)-like permease